MICEDCIHKVDTTEKHNGETSELRDYSYCSFISLDLYDMEELTKCSAFKLKPKESNEFKERRKIALQLGKEPRKKRKRAF